MEEDHLPGGPPPAAHFCHAASCCPPKERNKGDVAATQSIKKYVDREKAATLQRNTSLDSYLLARRPHLSPTLEPAPLFRRGAHLEPHVQN